MGKPVCWGGPWGREERGGDCTKGRCGGRGVLAGSLGLQGPQEVKGETKIYPLWRHRWGEMGQKKEALLLHDIPSVHHLKESIHIILASLCEVGPHFKRGNVVLREVR